MQWVGSGWKETVLFWGMSQSLRDYTETIPGCGLQKWEEDVQETLSKTKESQALELPLCGTWHSSVHLYS